MNRTIKFRGIDWETGEYVYGDLIQGNYDEVCPRIKPRKKKARYVKDVAQLVGYDKNGKEVYEGDTLVRDDGSETVVDYRDNPDYVHLHTLKEVSTPR